MSLELIELFFFIDCFRNQPATTSLPSSNFSSDEEDNGVCSRMEGSETLHCHGNSPPSRSIFFFISVSRGDTRDSRRRKMRTSGRTFVRFFWHSQHHEYSAVRHTADVVTTIRCYFFYLYRALKHGGHTETRWKAAVTRRTTLRPRLSLKELLLRYCPILFYPHYHCCYY